MPVPGKHDEESRTEIQGDLYAQWLDAREQAKSWRTRQDKLRAELEEQLGTSTGGMVNGRLVLTYRGKEKFAIAALVRDHPALTEHYMRTREVSELDIDIFAKIHPEIAEKYRIRELRVAGSEGEGNADQ